MDTSDKSYVHDAAVSWVENVNNDSFTACVMAAGYNERKSYANVTVDWMAYQGAPVGGVTGEVRMSQWWTGHSRPQCLRVLHAQKSSGSRLVDWYDLCDCHVSYSDSWLLLVFHVVSRSYLL